MTTTTDDLTTTDDGAASLRDEMARLRASTRDDPIGNYHAPVVAISHDDEYITVEFDPPLTDDTTTETFAKPTPPLGWHRVNRFVRWLEQTGYSAESLDELADSDTHVPITYTTDGADLVVPDYTPPDGGTSAWRRHAAAPGTWMVWVAVAFVGTFLTGGLALPVVPYVALAVACIAFVGALLAEFGVFDVADADLTATLKSDTTLTAANTYTQLDDRHVRIGYSSTSGAGALNSGERASVESHPEWQIVEREGDVTVVRYLGRIESADAH